MDTADVLPLISRIDKDVGLAGLSYLEAYQIFSLAKSSEKSKGLLAEVGVYKGASARLICEAKGPRELFLFDTFEGIPHVGEMDRGAYRRGAYACKIDKVTEYLKGFSGLHFCQGIFPQTATMLPADAVFSFVHLDVDVYKSTKDSLEYFYPRVNRGGFILSHDYAGAPGVRAAVDEFFADKDEPVVQLPGSQCLIVKL